MKALSLTQPWASLVVRGIKRYETRDWHYSPPWTIKSVSDHTPAIVTYEQPPLPITLAIHATKAYPREAIEYTRWLRDVVGVDITEDLPTGAVVGTVRYTGYCWSYASERAEILRDDFAGDRKAFELEQELGDWSESRILWRFDDPIEFDRPYPWRGAQRIWNWLVPDFGWKTPEDIAAMVAVGGR